MRMRAIILGNSGSGKIWLADRLAEHMTATVIHLDEFFWQPGGFSRKRSPIEVEELIAASKQSASWIVEGVFGELAARYLGDAGMLIWIDIDWATCRERLLARASESKRHMSREQSEKGLRDLIEWASLYYDRTDGRSWSGHKALFDGFRGDRLSLKSPEDVLEFVHSLQT